MNWRTGMQQGTFRGVTFHTDAHDATSGRRLALHEYPYRDKPYAEDLGRKGREFTLDAYVIGDDYMTARDELVQALEQSGPGNLVHPWLGSQVVAVQQYRLRESTREGGMAFFSITFVEAGELAYPAVASDTAAQVNEVADEALTESVDDFAESFSVDGFPDDILSDTLDELDRNLSDLENTIGQVVDDIAEEIRAPYNMATRIVGSIQRVQALVNKPLQAFNLYKSLFNTGEDNQAITQTTAVRKQQAQNNQALHNLIQRTAVIEAARVASVATYSSRDDALSVNDTLNEAIDNQVEVVDVVTGQPVSDSVYQALRRLRSAVNQDLRSRGARLPELTTYTPSVTLPSLVIAHQLYGDATRESELVERNNIRHAGFIAGGNELEVLNG